MLLSNFEITHILPCLADPEKIRTIAQLSDDVREVLPYLNAALKGTIYNHRAGILTFKKDGVMITLYPTTVTLAKADDEVHAKDMMEWLKGLINQTYENRTNIQPNYERGATLRALDIFKLIPGTNCKRCGEPSCLAFAVKLVGQETEIIKCDPLFTVEYQEKRRVLLELLYAAGYKGPSVFLDSETSGDKSMKVTIKFSAIPELVSIFKGKKEAQVDFTGHTVKDLLDHFALKVGTKKRDIFLNDQGRISPHVLVLINGRPISGLKRLGQGLQENDTVELTLPLG